MQLLALPYGWRKDVSSFLQGKGTRKNHCIVSKASFRHAARQNLVTYPYLGVLGAWNMWDLMAVAVGGYVRRLLHRPLVLLIFPFPA